MIKPVVCFHVGSYQLRRFSGVEFICPVCLDSGKRLLLDPADETGRLPYNNLPLFKKIRLLSGYLASVSLYSIKSLAKRSVRIYPFCAS